MDFLSRFPEALGNWLYANELLLELQGSIAVLKSVINNESDYQSFKKTRQTTEIDYLEEKYTLSEAKKILKLK